MLLGQASFADTDSEKKAVFADLTPLVLPHGWKEACALDIWSSADESASTFIEETDDESSWTELETEDEAIIRCKL